MSWTIHASGHTANEADEKVVIDNLVKAISAEGAGTSTARLFTQYHGTIDYPPTQNEPTDAAA
jgi:hypothetical protein